MSMYTTHLLLNIGLILLLTVHHFDFTLFNYYSQTWKKVGKTTPIEDKNLSERDLRRVPRVICMKIYTESLLRARSGKFLSSQGVISPTFWGYQKMNNEVYSEDDIKHSGFDKQLDLI